VGSGVKDANQVITRSEYDVYDRPTRVTAAYGLGEQTVSEMSYPSASANESRSSKQLDSTRWLSSKTVYDGFGRPLIVSQSEDGAHYLTANFTTNALHVQTIYDSLGRAVKVSNPYRTTAAETDGWTRTIFDLAGRVSEVATFSGAYNNPPPDSSTNSNWTGTIFTTSSGEQTTVKDQADKQRRSKLDGLGRLIQIDELNETGTLYATTLYSYDARNNLLSVNQSGQTRRFAYDGLSRLIRAKNPEQDSSSNSVFLYNGLDWSVKYEYDASSNLTAKTDTRFVNGQFVKVSYGYDEINRVTSRSYTDGTPPVSYGYDTATKGVGQLSFVEAVGVSKYNYTAYDSLGRATAYNQQTSGQTYSMTNSYNKAGMVTSQGYPSTTKTVLTEYDGAGRVAGVKQEGATGYYAGATSSDATNRIQYTAHGGASKMKLGNGLWEHTAYNSRLQPVQKGLGTASTNSSVLQIDYVYGASATTNSGNVTRQTITAAQTLVMVQDYQYDQVNRLKEAKESIGGSQQWKQVYGYDTFGNRWVTVDSTLVPSPLTPRVESAFSATTNRILASQYDAAGNQKVDGQGRTFNYDGENRQTGFNGGAGAYSYDGDGRRVKKTDVTGSVVFVYSVGGQLLAEYHSDPVPPPAGGGGVSYLTGDHLGSTRVVTKGDGSVKARYDYLPFGEELGAGISGRSGAMGYSAADSTNQKFTSKERDGESGLDYFGARYYSSAQGRFTSPDPLIYTATRPGDPQQFNLYGYVRNNPMRFVDPDGKDLNVVATQQEREQIGGRLRQIAPGSKVDAQGRVHKPSFFRRLWNSITGHRAGTALVSRLVDSRQTTTIIARSGTNNAGVSPTNLQAMNQGQPTGAIIEYDPGVNRTSSDRTPDAKGNITAISPIQVRAADPAIVLGHELIHADHITSGNINIAQGPHDFVEGNVAYRENESSEELRTVGFAGHVRRGDITENQLRKELKVMPRATYSYRPDWIRINP
jgi:RHS repeat-associated protein